MFPNKTNIISTCNQQGFTYPLSEYGKAFVSFAQSAQRPLLDIGAAFGIATIPALEMGADVIAVDIERKHLDRINQNVPQHLKNNLKTLQGRFPDIDFPTNSLAGVYISQVFPFLTGHEIEIGVKKIFNWLIPGGKVFVIAFTPYIKHCESFIPVYEKRLNEGKHWAGFIDDLSRYSSYKNIASHLPNQINHIDKSDLKRVLDRARFIIEKLEYFGDDEGSLPDGIRLDNRERVGAIATKPLNYKKL